MRSGRGAQWRFHSVGMWDVSLHGKLLQAVSYDPSGHKASQLHKMSPGEWKHSPKGADRERAVFWKEELGEARDSQGTPGAQPLGRAGHAGPSPEGRP